MCRAMESRTSRCLSPIAVSRNHSVRCCFDIHCLPLPGAKSRCGDSRKCRGNEFRHNGTVDACHNQAGSRNDIDQPAECRLDCFQIRVNIGVIELDVLQQGDSRQVVKKLWSFIEKGRVVLVALDYEIGTVPELKTASEIFGDTADKE